MLFRIFLVIYLVVAIPAAVFIAFPQALYLAVVLTFGIAFPLFFAPTAAVYLTALWPAALAWRNGRRVAAAVLAVAVPAITAFVPGLLATPVAKTDAAAILAGDVTGRLPGAFRAIEIEMVMPTWGREPLRNAPCGEICQTLLLGRDVDAVRIRAVTEARRRAVQTIVYSYEERPACPKAFADAEAALPATQLAAAYGRCLVPTVSETWTPGTRLVITKERKGWKSRAPLLYTDGERTRCELQVAEGTSWRVVSRATGLRTEVLKVPLILGFSRQMAYSAWKRSEVMFGATSATAMLRASGDYRVTMPKPPSPEPLRQTIDRILSAGGDEPIGPALMAVINRHLRTLRGVRELSPQDVGLLQRLLTSPRVVDYFQVYQVLGRHPDVAAPVIGDILERIEQLANEPFGQKNLAWIVVRAPIESVRPYGQRILEIADLSDKWYLAALLRIVGRLDVDGSDLLRRRLKAESHNVRKAAAIGVCAADQHGPQSWCRKWRAFSTFTGAGAGAVTTISLSR